MAFQVNPKDPDCTDEEWRIGVKAYEAGLDPQAAIDQFRKSGIEMIPHTPAAEPTELSDAAEATTLPSVEVPKRGRKK